MEALDNPDQLKFVRAGQKEEIPKAQILAEWEEKLIGQAKDAFMRGYLPSQAVFDKIERMSGMFARMGAAANAAKKGGG